MENNDPTAQWAKLPTLSQLTAKRKSTLMDTTRPNQFDNDDEHRSGLITPPNSQDATKMLISPPPEEVLRFGFGRKHAGAAVPPFTPSLLASRPASVNSKRKRPGVVTSAIDSPSTTTKINNKDNTTITTETDPQPPEATPNPKPRKQSKQHARTQSFDSPTRVNFPRVPTASSQVHTTPTKTKEKAKSASPMKAKRVLIQSPHASNPDADFIPPVSISSRGYLSAAGSGSALGRVLSRRSRSATPIPPYEPPKEVFTPPREVTITPPFVQSKSRRSRSKSRGARSRTPEVRKGELGLGVKKELPDIDWTLPMPPPSPGDDPLLLSGRPRRPRLGLRGELHDDEDEEEEEEETMELDVHALGGMEGLMDVSMDEIDLDVPPSTDFSDGEDAMPIFDLAGGQDDDVGAWSDSDDDSDEGKGMGGGEEGEGEYTGRFTMLTVRTKADPPTSATRERMEGWGRPVSPYPGAKAKKRFGLPSVGELGGGKGGEEDEEMGELPVIGDDGHEEDEEEEAQHESGEEDDDVEEEADEEEHSLVEAARDADGAEDLESGEEDGAAEDSLGGEDGDCDMSVELRGRERLQLQEQDMSYDQQHQEELVSFEAGEGDDAGEQEQDRSVLPDQKEEEEDASSQETSFSFTRELSVEEEEELEEEQNVDRELSCEPRDEEEEEQRKEVLTGHGEKSVLNTVRTYESRQARASSSGRWDKPLRPSDFGQAFPGFSRLGSKPPEVVEDEDILDESMVDVEDGSSSEDEGDSLQEDGVVTITSGDPLAAARAAAILKLHDYDYLPKILLKHRRLSHSTPEGASRNARRKSAIESGVSKHSPSDSARKRRRRSTLGGMIGDNRVFIPGSPVMTLPELLLQAEEGLEREEGVAHGTPVKNSGLGFSIHRDPFKTPAPRGASMLSGTREEREETREWTKDDWKQLDACFTDERLDVAEKLGLGSDKIADVDDVKVEDVVERFVEMMGGSRVVDEWGSDWDRDNLLTRTRALQKKQRSGNIAPPTPGRQSPMSSRLSVVPDFTPITRLRPHPPALRPKLPPPMTGSPFGNLPLGRRPKVPGSLLAPRYSHLLEEAIAVSQDELSTPQPVVDMSVSPFESEAADVSVESAVNTDPDYHQEESFDSSVSVEQDVPPPVEQPSPGLSKRVKGFFFSYLPTLSKSTPPQKSKKPRSNQPGLPLPPPELLGKARGPISTPVRPPLPRAVPPKEQVHLQHAPSPKKPTFPRPQKPQRLVALHPTPAPAPTMPVPIQRNRRSSGGSVKDLVKSFEDLDSDAVVKKSEIKRVRSIGDWKGDRCKGDRPAWRP